MATASEIAQACHLLASQIQTTHQPNVQNALSQIGSALETLVNDGEQVLTGNFSPLHESFVQLNGHFQPILSWLDEHPTHLTNLSQQLQALASDVL